MSDEDEQRRYDELVARCYECVLDRSAWPALLEQLSTASDFHLGTLLLWNGPGDVPQATAYNNRFAPTTIELYNQHYCTLDPTRHMMLRRHVGSWYHDREELPPEWIRRDPYYQEFHLPNGLGDLFCVKLLEESDAAIYLSLLTAANAPVPSGPQTRLLQRLTPHLLVAARLARRLDDMAQALARRDLLLGQYPTPAWLLDADSRLLHCNPAAERLMALAPSPLHQHAGRLHCHREDARLQSLIQRAAGRSGPPCAGWLPLVANQQHGLLLTPRRADVPGNALCQRPLVLLTLLDNQRHLAPLHELFNLTPAEQRLAELLCEGLLPKECAMQLEVSINTVRSQLRSLFRKTGTEHQTELVRLLTRLQQL